MLAVLWLEVAKGESDVSAELRSFSEHPLDNIARVDYS